MAHYLRPHYVGNCCAVGLLEHFPTNSYFNPQDVRSDIKEAIQAARRDGRSMLFASINNHQSLCEPLLLKAGFKCANEDWAYRNPSYSGNRNGVKVFIKELYKPRKKKEAV